MTYLGKQEQFKCDTCGKIEMVHTGLPKGWFWVKTGGSPDHACEKCSKDIPKDRLRKAGEKN